MSASTRHQGFRSVRSAYTDCIKRAGAANKITIYKWCGHFISIPGKGVPPAEAVEEVVIKKTPKGWPAY